MTKQQKDTQATQSIPEEAPEPLLKDICKALFFLTALTLAIAYVFIRDLILRIFPTNREDSK